MSGILASSASKTMVSGDTSADNAESGYIAGERIALSTSPTGSSYSWGQAIPAGSAIARSALTDDTAAAPTFIPDVAGEYVLTCDVDGVAYVLRLSVTQTAMSTSAEALRLQSKTNASIQEPPTGSAIFHSTDYDAPAVEDAAGVFYRIGRSLRGSKTWDPGNIADGAITSTTVTVTGAAVGDRVSAGFSIAVPAGALLVPAVTATDTVTVTLFNKTGSPLDLASGTLSADVWK